MSSSKEEKAHLLPSPRSSSPWRKSSSPTLSPSLKRSNRSYSVPDNTIIYQNRHKDQHLRNSSTSTSSSSNCLHENPGLYNDLTALQYGKRELYDSVPWLSISGLQSHERSLLRDYATWSVHQSRLLSYSKSQPNLKFIRELENGTMTHEQRIANLLEIECGSEILTPSLLLCVFAALVSQFLVGYNTGVMNPLASSVFPGHSTFQWSFAVAAFAIGGPIGAAKAGRMADAIGRRKAMFFNLAVFAFGGLLLSVAPSIYVLILARCIVGFASGYSTVLVPIYLGEISPPNLRGSLGTCSQFGVVIGILFADLGGLMTSNWRALFTGTFLISASMIIILSIPKKGVVHGLLESPRWLLMTTTSDSCTTSNNKNSRIPASDFTPSSEGLSNEQRREHAKMIIKRLRGFRNEYEVDIEVGHIVNTNTTLLSPNTTPTTRNTETKNKRKNPEGTSTQGTLASDLLGESSTRPLFVACIALQMSQQLCGINAVFYYSTTFFEGVIDDPSVGTTIVGAVNVVATYVALLLMDKCGRRQLILWSSGGMLLSCIVMILSLSGVIENLPKSVLLISTVSYVSFFEIGLGPIPWLFIAEVFDNRHATYVMSICCQVNWACNFVVGVVFPFMNERIGFLSFLPFSIVLFVTFLSALMFFPDINYREVNENIAKRRKVKRQSINLSTFSELTSSSSSVPSPLIAKSKAKAKAKAKANANAHPSVTNVSFYENSKKEASLDHAEDEDGEECGDTGVKLTHWQKNLSCSPILDL